MGIIFIVKMSETPDGIGTVQEEQEKYNKTLQEKEKADKQYQDALQNAIKSKGAAGRQPAAVPRKTPR